jgi:hypothetical protein
MLQACAPCCPCLQTVDSMAQDVVELLNQLRIESVVVMGASGVAGHWQGLQSSVGRKLGPALNPSPRLCHRAVSLIDAYQEHLPAHARPSLDVL